MSTNTNTNAKPAKPAKPGPSTATPAEQAAPAAPVSPVPKQTGKAARTTRPKTSATPKAGTATVHLAAPAPAPKPAPRRPAATRLASPAEPPVVSAPASAAKATKARQKLVRDSFTMPRADFALIHQLKERAMGFKRAAKKSELLRAGLQALAAMDDRQLQVLLAELPVLKTGRPKKSG